MIILSHGRRSEIYDYSKDTILKLYDKEFPKEKIQNEYTKTRTIYKCKNVQIPEPLELVTLNNRVGIVFEKIDGISMMDLFQQKPWLYFSYINKICTLHRGVNQHQIEGLSSQVDEFLNIIEQTPLLEVVQKEKLLEILNRNSDYHLCHGDFHHGNIIVSDKKYYIIDWMDAFSGNYLLDVALTAVNTMVSDAPNHVPNVYRMLYELIKRVVKLDKRYLGLYGLEKKDIRDYLLLASGIHLARSNPLKNKGHKAYFNELWNKY